jgi:hypothetical protein
MSTRRALVLIAGLLAAGLAHAQAYKCRSESGATVYQQVPCAPEAAQKKLDAAPPPAPDTGAEFKPEFAGVMMTLGFKRWCDTNVPGFAEQVASDWSRWRSDIMVALRAVETNPRYLESLRKQPADFGNVARDKARFMCTPQWVRDLANKQRGPAFATSPESTWRHLIEALARADRQEALNCYSIESRAKYGPALEALSDDQLKGQAARWKLVPGGTRDKEWREFFIQDGDKRAGLVYFYNFGGSWLITEM